MLGFSKFRFGLLAALLAGTTVLAQDQGDRQKRDLKVETDAELQARKDAEALGVPRSYALVVGIGDYGKLAEKSWLKYSTQDADAIYKILISPEGGNFRAENVHRLTGKDATLANLTHELEDHYLSSIFGSGNDETSMQGSL